MNEVPASDVARLLGLIDLFMPTRQDIAQIFPGKAPLDALRALREIAPDTPVIIMKCGAAGAIAHERDAPEHLDSPTVSGSAIDETGAGDAFCGGALVGFSHSLTLREALARAVVSASFAIEAVGSSGLVSASPEEAERRFRRAADRIEARPL